MKAVHFGAGNIGRGFIALLLSHSGYDVTFVARNEKQVALLKQRSQYAVTLANEAKDTVLVQYANAISVSNERAVAEAVAAADIVTTAVGVNSLKQIAESIARGITLRLRDGDDRPLHIIACENAIGGSSLLKKKVFAYLPEDCRAAAAGRIAFPDTAVDRIVPLQQHDDPLKVTVEPYYEWIVESSAMLDGFDGVEGMKYVESLKPYIERKLFTVNTGHAAAAYHGYLNGCETIQDVMEDPVLKKEVSNVLLETGSLLTAKYHWDELKHRKYIHQMMSRFMNPRLSDKVVRVGRSPLRKLSLHDRLIRPTLQAHELGMETRHLTAVIAAALQFDYEEDQEAVELQSILRTEGIHHVIQQVMGISPQHPVHRQIASRYGEREIRRLKIGGE
ncbi:mannitol-1-phosphate 5-dehydrogenase [Paenibacillus radicis (ex Gao et al. 2016)]|uniref:Mannitol-1-phosphate 5-dehydrogenase n=1 Tax=Paenibacillus radicis (ex Gao et al. 2016) TaxID=1737354 RepID=A0A917H2Y3_9BACL|nr:mannitol-1-phosphate 5-dehydrogenase [Paenibacillus radicis (ex Gao et al. 2016)]GGG66308.1 mannitol-1-phosphate 5-dehydrogenase [Paenibacillus radicis (ex Gao et al. 2016)]